MALGVAARSASRGTLWPADCRVQTQAPEANPSPPQRPCACTRRNEGVGGVLGTICHIIHFPQKGGPILWQRHREGTALALHSLNQHFCRACCVHRVLGVRALGGRDGASPCFHRESCGRGTGDQRTGSLCDSPGGATEGSRSRAQRGSEGLRAPASARPSPAGCSQDPALGPRERAVWAPGG